jgi:hypothetical protein
MQLSSRGAACLACGAFLDSAVAYSLAIAIHEGAWRYEAFV